MPDRPPRLIDLRVDWFAQYAGEAPQFDAYPVAAGRLPQVDGYLGATAAAFLTIEPALIPRAEAEFAGRLLIGPADYRRWMDDPEGMAWGALGVEGVGVERIGGLYQRGVRLFRVVEDFDSYLGKLVSLSEPGGRPIADVSGPGAAALGWFEADAARSASVVPVWGRGPVDGETARRLRSLGGFLAMELGEGAVADLVARVEAAGGPEGVVLATGFLGSDGTTAGMGDAPAVIGAVMEVFETTAGRQILFENGRRLIERSVGGG